jgi:hypothetical protein
MQAMSVNSADPDTIKLKKRHCTKVQRKVADANMTPHPRRYPKDKTKNISMGILSSRRTANHPYKNVK